jgi:hypothetical protein
MLVIFLYIAIGSQLLLSAVTKLRDFSTFLSILKTYSIPNFLKNNFFAGLIVLTETSFGIFLLSLNAEIIWIGALGTTFFLILANLLVVLRLKKGEKKIRCGCGESLDEEQNAIWLLVRNTGLIFILVFGLKEALPTVSLLSIAALYIFLAGWGLLSAAKLSAAFFRTILNIRQWKAAG